MGRYCSVSQVAQRFRRVTDVESYALTVESHYILFAEAELDQRMAKYFTVPFSSNNQTATDLAIDLSYAKVIIYDDPEKYTAIIESVEGRIRALNDGTTAMIISDGTQLFSSAATTGRAWSNTSSYHSSFGMGCVETFHPDENMLRAEDDGTI